MKKILILLVFSAFVASCDKKEVKKAPIKIDTPIVKDTIKEIVEVEEIPTLFFTVQIAALKKSNANFDALKDIQVFHEDNLTKYRFGQFATYKEARAARKLLLTTYSDAFVQAVKNGKPINIKEALSN
ncbi:SPOR domain-containing protein [Polaribacter sp.]|uniref:SPOR domain-containing protein n=1 Tax=Polaribacter sp. TaxID=1920175 RepID=UPI003EF38AB3